MGNEKGENDASKSSSFDLLNLHTYGWQEAFFILTMLAVLVTACGCLLCYYHNRKLKENDFVITEVRDKTKITKLTTVQSLANEDETGIRVGHSIYQYDEDGHAKNEFVDEDNDEM